MSIFIFSRPVHSGKTTELQHYCTTQLTTTAAGILMPDVNGQRKIFNIGTKEVLDIECKDPANAKEPLQAVGKYHFYNNAFEKANAILMEAAAGDNKWLIIDEVGKLELQCNGLYEATNKILQREDYKTPARDLLLVIRDSLYQQAISFFNITAHTLIHRLNDLDLQGNIIHA